MKYIRVLSDIHLEQFYGKPTKQLVEQFVPADEKDADSILVLAGDISSKIDQLILFLQDLEPRFESILFVPGNHEWYRHDYDGWCQDMTKRLTEETTKVAYAIDGVSQFETDGVRFIFCTLWGDGGATAKDQANVDYGLNDFRVIQYKGERFKVGDMMRIHQEQKAELVRRLKVPFLGKTVVVTHHLPSYRLCHPRFGNEINGGFASNCDDILAYDHAPDLWVAGHTHDSIITKLWNTKIVINPSGYKSEFMSPFNHFKPLFISADTLEPV